jgi:hypothetical protein
MRNDPEECVCPLCGGPAKAEPTGMRSRLIRCDKCTIFEIVDGLEGELSENLDAETRDYLSDAARRATHGAEKNAIDFRLKLEGGSKECSVEASQERERQRLVQPVVDYLEGERVKVIGKYSHSFEYLEVELPNGEKTTLKVETDVLDRPTEWIVPYCRDHDIARELARSPRAGVEINRSAGIPRRLQG